MKITKQEQKIRNIYKNVRTPGTVSTQIDETLDLIRQQNDTDHNICIKKKYRTPLTFKRAAIAAAAAIMCIGGTVFAAERLYQMHLDKEKEYQRSLIISSGEALPAEVPEVKVDVTYIPEGFTANPYKGIEHYYTKPEGDDAGYYVGDPILIDEADPMSVSFVNDAETLTIDGHDAIYICYTYNTDKSWKNDELFILYEEMNRILRVGSWGHTDKNELIKIAENTSLTPTGNMTSTEGLLCWSKIVNERVWAEQDSDEIAADYYFDEADETQMANTHQVGDRFNIHSTLDDENMTDVQLEASVTNVQVSDDLSLLTEKNTKITKYWEELTDSDGRLTSDTLNYIKSGDGENTLPEIIRTEDSPVKLVYATVEYTNPGAETLNDVYYRTSLLPIVKDGETYRIFNRSDGICDYVENENAGVRYEMAYADVTGGHNHNNYIPEIKPGESVTIHFAWVVNEDELDKLYLNFGDFPFTEDGLETGLVDLNL